MEDTGDVCTDPSEPTLSAQEIHSSKHITGPEAHKTRKNHCGTHWYFLRPYITLSIVTDAAWPPCHHGPASIGTRSSCARSPAPAAPDPSPQGQQLPLCSRERAQGAAEQPPKHPPEAVPILWGAGGCPGLQRGDPDSGGCTGRCFGASAPPVTRDVPELCPVPFLLVFGKN